MNPFHALLLGALQGLTEVLPISSSAHLLLVPWLLGWPESGLTFDVALHLGTFLAMAVYFRRDIIEMLVAVVDALRTSSLDTPARRLPFLVVASALPAALVGMLFETQLEELFRSRPLLIGLFLILFGVGLGLADLLGRKRRFIAQLTVVDAVVIGLFQSLALIPGVSRSGITITAALMLGFNRVGAARFSFLMSLPIVAGAALFKMLALLERGIPSGEGLPLAIGILTSTITGYISVAFLLRFVQKHSIAPFVWYRLVAGGAVVSALLTGIIP